MRRRGAADLLFEPLHRLALADEDLFEREVALEIAHLLAQAAIAEGVIDGEQHALERERLLEKVVRAEARGA